MSMFNPNDPLSHNFPKTKEPPPQGSQLQASKFEINMFKFDFNI